MKRSYQLSFLLALLFLAAGAIAWPTSRGSKEPTYAPREEAKAVKVARYLLASAVLVGVVGMLLFLAEDGRGYLFPAVVGLLFVGIGLSGMRRARKNVIPPDDPLEREWWAYEGVNAGMLAGFGAPDHIHRC